MRSNRQANEVRIELAAIENMSRSELETNWLHAFGCDPPDVTRPGEACLTRPGVKAKQEPAYNQIGALATRQNLDGLSLESAAGPLHAVLHDDTGRQVSQRISGFTFTDMP